MGKRTNRPAPPVPLSPPPEKLPEWRCPRCGQRIGDGTLAPGSKVVIKCSKCNLYVTRMA